MDDIKRFWAVSSGGKVHGAFPADTKALAESGGRSWWEIPATDLVTTREVCGGCIDGGVEASDPGIGEPEYRYAGLMLCYDCEDGYRQEEDDARGMDRDEDDYSDFADPGGRSALWAASEDNPRNLPCPSCRREDMLTPADRQRGYQCDRCADACERGADY